MPNLSHDAVYVQNLWRWIANMLYATAASIKTDIFQSVRKVGENEDKDKMRDRLRGKRRLAGAS